jgi:mitochondrial-processing peptidase subunit alpha
MSNIVSELESMGSHVTTSSSREVLVYSAEILRHHVERTMELIAETTQQPQFNADELEDQLRAYSFDYEENSTNPDLFIPELLHKAAFGDQTMGQSLLIAPEQLQSLSADSLRNYMTERYIGSNMVICGAGVDHDMLVKLADNYFGKVPSISPSKIVGLDRPIYHGGEIRVPIPQDKEEKHNKVHVMIGFEAGGFDDPDFYILYTLNSMMGGGTSFSSGGPGKGMYTRLYTRVLNRYGWIDAAETYVSSYKDNGLFGMYAKADPDRLTDLLKIVCGELIEVSKKVSKEELIRAKNQLKTSIFMNLESRGILFDDIGRQVLLYNKRYTAQELCDLIDSVTMEDLARVTRRILATPPSLVYYASQEQLDSLPEYKQVQRVLMPQ